MAGCDALGFNFHPASPRYVLPEQARSIIAALPPLVTTVGLFVDAPVQTSRDIASVAGVGLLQFHGDETDEECVAVGLPYIKALRVAEPIGAPEIERRFPRASAILLDCWEPDRHGGTGRSWDWALWPRGCSKPLILAGGLSAANVADAIARTRPFAVDVASGVEGDVAGWKDPEKLRNFMSEVQRAQWSE